MKRSMMVLLFGLSFLACSKEQSPLKPGFGNEVYTGSYSTLKCQPGKNYQAKKESFISWRATKIGRDGKETSLVGTNSIVGNLVLQDNTWKTAAATINFVSSSTNS